MKTRILELIKAYPKHYTVKIKNNEEMMSWIMENSKAQYTDHLPTIIYSAIYDESNVCKNGNTKKIYRFNEGYTLCGPSKKCQCCMELASQNSKLMHQSFDDNKKKEISEKRKHTMIEKYGVPYNLLRDDVKLKLTRPKIKDSTYEKLSNYEWLDTEYNVKKRSAVDIARDFNIYYGTVIDYCKSHGFNIRKRSAYSIIENEICDYITSLGVECESSDWNIVIGKEIDLYIPSKNIAIEINGLYWHSYHPSSNKDENMFKNKHIYKTESCIEQNIQLLHFTDWQWYNKQDIVKSIIKTKLGLNTRIAARKCTILPITSKNAREFFTKTHIDGFSGGEHHGLFYNNELIMAITVGKPRFSTTTAKELIRCATKHNITVIGGLSKLLKHIKRKYDLPIITYCDKNISIGNAYSSVGFTYIGDTKLNYFWTDGNNIISRYTTQKSNLEKLLGDGFNPNLTEKQNMFNAGYRIYWGCGSMIFIM
jgi:hypothetical protein